MFAFMIYIDRVCAQVFSKRVIKTFAKLNPDVMLTIVYTLQNSIYFTNNTNFTIVLDTGNILGEAV